MTGRLRPEDGALASTFVGQLNAYVRRYRLVTFARLLPAAVAAALTIDALVVITTAPRGATTVAFVVASFIVAAAAVAGFTFAVTRPRSAIAATIDARLALRDHVVTAWQFRHETDPVSRAILVGALDRLRANPAAAMPFERPTFFAGTLAAIAVSSALCVERTAAVPAAGEFAAPASVSAQEATNTNRRPRIDDSRPTGRPAIATKSSIAAAPGARQRDAVSVPGVVQTSGTARASASDGRGDERDREISRAGNDREHTAPDRPSGGAAGRQPSHAAVDGAGRAGSAEVGFGRGGSAPSRRAPGAAAGGVSRGVVDSDAVDGAAPADSRGAQITPYAARERAEQAIARGRVPQRLRSLVRAYFSATPTEKPR